MSEGAPDVEAPFCLVDDDGVLDHGRVVKKRAIRCALSRICGVCAESLAWPVAFVGTTDEAGRGAFVLPPMHETCARALLDRWHDAGEGHLGHEQAPEGWALVTTGGFDLERPASRTGDQRVWFHPNSVVSTTPVHAGPSTAVCDADHIHGA